MIVSNKLDKGIFFDDFITSGLFDKLNSKSKSPLTNIQKNENQIIIELLVPKFLKSDFKLSIEKDVLTVTGKSSRKNEGGSYSRKEFGNSNFETSYKLPSSVNLNEIDASYDEGVLSVSIPFVKEEKVLKNILVK